MFDIIIRGGTVVDGSGSPPKRADVGVLGDTIQAVGDLSAASAERVIAAEGRTITPGFVDTHTHSEGVLLSEPLHANALMQGITTVITGLDGMSFAPLSPSRYSEYRWWLSGLHGRPPDDILTGSVDGFLSNFRHVGVNVAYLVPHATIRLEIAGFVDVPLDHDQIRVAQRMIRQGLDEGAVGFSSGGSYYPGPWADTDELSAMCEALREGGGVYVAETRRANLERAYGHDGLAEALEVARVARVPLHLAHFRTSPATASRPSELVGPVDKARKDLVDVTFDIYPYPTGSSILVGLLPSWAQEGGPSDILARLRSGDRDRIAAWLNEHRQEALTEAVISYGGERSELEGNSIATLATRDHVTVGEMLCSLLDWTDLEIGFVVSPPTDPAIWEQVDRDAMSLLSRPDYMVCSDITPLGGFCHPRSFGAYPRFLGRLRRRYDTISLEDMVERMTSRPARRFGMSKRGRISEGWYADLVVLDPERLTDVATYDDPRQPAIGVEAVLINGGMAVDGGRPTGGLHGVPVRRHH